MSSITRLHLNESRQQTPSLIQPATWVHRAKDGFMKIWKVAIEKHSIITLVISALFITALAFISWPTAIAAACVLPLLVLNERSRASSLEKHNDELKIENGTLTELNHELHGQLKTHCVAEEHLMNEIQQLKELRDQETEETVAEPPMQPQAILEMEPFIPPCQKCEEAEKALSALAAKGPILGDDQDVWRMKQKLGRVMQERFAEAENTARLSRDNENLTRACKDAREEAKTAFQERDEAEARALAVIQGKAHLNRVNQELQRELDELKSDHSDTTQELKAAKAALSSEVEAKIRLQEQVRDLHLQMVANNREKIAAIKGRDHALEATLNEIDGKSKLIRECASLSQENEQLNQQVQLLKKQNDEAIQKNKEYQRSFETIQLKAKLKADLPTRPQIKLEELLRTFEDHKNDRYEMLTQTIQEYPEDSIPRIHLEEIVRINQEEFSLVRARITETLYLDEMLRKNLEFSLQESQRWFAKADPIELSEV